MTSKSKGGKPAKNVGQTLAFKRRASIDEFEENLVVEIPRPIPPPKSKPPRKYQRFGFANDGGRYELLQDAISRGRLRLAKVFISLLPPRSAIDMVTPTGENSVLLALKSVEDTKRRRRMIEFLVSSGASVSYVNPNTGETVVHYCCGKIPERHSDLKWFLSRWPVELDITKADFKGNNALHCAVANGDFSMVVTILRVAQKNSTDLDVRNNEKLTPYLLAHKLGHVEIADIIDKTAASGISALDSYLTKSARIASGRRSVRDENDLIFPALVNHTLPSRFDGVQMPLRHRTAIRHEGDEERLSQRLNSTMKKRLQLLINGQPEYFPRIPLPSAIVRRRNEAISMQHRSLQNLDDALALLPDYAITQEIIKSQPAPLSNRASVSFRKTVGKPQK